jgi:hypothetical protein
MIVIVFLALIGAIYVSEKTPEPIKVTTKEIVEHEKRFREMK